MSYLQNNVRASPCDIHQITDSEETTPRCVYTRCKFRCCSYKCALLPVIFYHVIRYQKGAIG